MMSPLETLLTLCLIRPMKPKALSSIQQMLAEGCSPDSLLELARSNKVEPVVCEALNVALETRSLPERCPGIIDQAGRKTRWLLTELDALSQAIVAVGCEWILLENGAIARRYFPQSPHLFSFGDFDLLVHPSQLERISHALESQGYWKTRASEPGVRKVYEKKIGEEVEPLRLNLQSSWIARRWFSPLRMDMEGLFSRSEPVPGSGVRILGPEDFLCQLAMHSASHSYVYKPGVRLHMDLDWFLRRQSVDWPQFVKQVQGLHVKTAVYFSLAIPHELFGTPIPPEVLRSLRPAPWKERLLHRWIRKAGLFNPQERKFSRLGYIVFVGLLYDDLSSLFSSIFPPPAWMRQRYAASGPSLLLAYLRRWFDLLFRRENI